MTAARIVRNTELNQAVFYRDRQISDLHQSFDERAAPRSYELNHPVREILDSTSWRLSATFRFVGRLLRPRAMQFARCDMRDPPRAVSRPLEKRVGLDKDERQSSGSNRESCPRHSCKTPLPYRPESPPIATTTPNGFAVTIRSDADR